MLGQTDGLRILATGSMAKTANFEYLNANFSKFKRISMRNFHDSTSNKQPIELAEATFLVSKED